MLTEPKLKTLQGFLETLTEDELIWINGYLAGLVSNKSSSKTAVSTTHKITILYGTESGNSKKIATEFANQAKKSGVQAKLVSLDQYRLTDLQKEEHVLVVISTQGDGEPPASAKKFYDYLQENTLSLPKLNFGVLALGDTAYPLFCKAGEDIDCRLQQLGATRAVAIQKCDTDFEEESQAWFKNALSTLTSGSGMTVPVAKRHNGKKNYKGTLLSNINLSGRGSAKQTRHIEIAADELQYQPGDSIGIIPENPHAIVTSILRLLNWEANRKLVFKGSEYSTEELLLKKVNIVYLPERVVTKYAALVQQEIPPMRIDLLNLLKIYPVKDSSQFEDVISILEPITPRLYSISSSPSAHIGEIHLTVARDIFTVNDEIRYGLCSDYFSRLEVTAPVEFYVHKNSQFKLPAHDRDIIMIGPGTGIAPFRSFIAERDVMGATGKNWLFFGDQRFSSDFLYQTEIQAYIQSGVLTKVSVAFSRDQAEKIYVQHRMLEQAEELFRWIDEGALIYLCGAKDPMGEDVERTLFDIISLCGKKTPEEAAFYLNKMKEEGRFQRDVY
jgi:sulfite reductase (NADPH) flavoprotein alpha-component